MRRPLFMLPATTALAALAALTALGALGCEDGPAQTFSAAPPNAGSIWNDGNVAPAVPDAGQSYDAGYPTLGALSLCGTDFKRQRWAWMLEQPISPPRHYAGIDLAKDDLWDGLTIGDAEQPPANPEADAGGLCQSVPLGFSGGCPSGLGECNLNYWGNNQEVSFSWNIATDIIDQMVMQLGYTGPMTTIAYPDHNGEPHAWKVTIGDVIRRDDMPFEMDWTATKTINIQITDIFNAVMATFAVAGGVPFNTATCTDDSTCQAPGISAICECTHVAGSTKCDTTVPNNKGQCGIANCGTDGNCLVYNNGVNTIFGIRPMVVYVQGNAGVPQPALSTPTLVYNFFSKWEPFSYLPQVVKIDGEGPVAQGNPVGDPTGKLLCKQINGQTFAEFTSTCVQVQNPTTPTQVDIVNLNKVTHSLTHDQEHWTANVLGVNQNFTSLKVANNPNIVVLDTDQPQPGDIAQDWTFDVRARGAVANDNNQNPTDYHIPGDTEQLQGSALVMIEWSRLLLADISRILGTPAPTLLGDTRCTGFDSSGAPTYEASNQPGPDYVGCSGIEGMILPNAAVSYGTVALDFSGDPNPLPNTTPAGSYPGNNADVFGIYGGLLKPGDEFGAFCVDPGVESDCISNSGVSIFQNALTQVARVLGGGVQANLPAELQDRRYYFKWFGIAYIKYMKAYGNYALANPTTVNSFPTGTVGSGLAPSDVDAQQIDLESLFFDYAFEGSGTFDKFEYIDREFIGKGTGGTYNWVPWDFEYGCDLFGGNQRYDNWYRRMDREEIAMFSSMVVNKTTDTAGLENNVNITNLFGSTLLGGNAVAGVAGVFPSYACAIGQAGDPQANCGELNAPLDPTNPSGAPPCDATGACPGTMVCGAGYSFVNGIVQNCGEPCVFATDANGNTIGSGCTSPSQTCAGLAEACLDMEMDKNGPTVVAAGAPGANAAVTPHPVLYYYPGAWSQTPFSSGHSPITLAQADKQPDIGVAKITIPNFSAGPYTFSPIPASTCKTTADCSTGSTCGTGGFCTCGTGYTASTDGVWCNAKLNAGTGYMAPSFTPLTPWAEVQPAVGFSIPLDAQHSQWVATGQLDFTGVLETYIVDYVPYVDLGKSSCVADGVCNTGFTCDPTSQTCVTNDNTIQIQAIEGADFLGQAFVCVDPSTDDILHVGMYDSAVSILNWFAAHPGSNPGYGGNVSAQTACQVLFIRSPYDNYVDYIVSKQYGVLLNMGGGQGQGRVTDIVLFNPALIQAL